MNNSKVKSQEVWYHCKNNNLQLCGRWSLFIRVKNNPELPELKPLEVLVEQIFSLDMFSYQLQMVQPKRIWSVTAGCHKYTCLEIVMSVIEILVFVILCLVMGFVMFYKGIVLKAIFLARTELDSWSFPSFDWLSKSDTILLTVTKNIYVTYTGKLNSS